MKVLERPSEHDRRARRQARARRRRRFPRWVAFALALVAVFLTGMAFGRALDDAPEPGGVTTSVRTLNPLPQLPPARTVTVTVTER
jgi:type VI protein secretion system component VasF